MQFQLGWYGRDTRAAHCPRRRSRTRVCCLHLWIYSFTLNFIIKMLECTLWKVKALVHQSPISSCHHLILLELSRIYQLVDSLICERINRSHFFFFYKIKGKLKTSENLPLNTSACSYLEFNICLLFSFQHTIKLQILGLPLMIWTDTCAYTMQTSDNV